METQEYEVDQSGMQMHERCARKVCNKGLLGPWMRLFSRMKSRVDCCEQYETVIAHMFKALEFDFIGISMKVVVERAGVKRTIRCLDFYMTSSWRLTYTFNFLVETVAILCCFTPRYLLHMRGDEGNLRNMESVLFDSWAGVKFRISSRIPPCWGPIVPT